MVLVKDRKGIAVYMKKLGKSFYLQDTITIAKELLGKYLVHETASYKTAGRIVETEAYTGTSDKACHAFGGRRSSRNEIMYGAGGSAYVFLIYGMYYCFNVVTEGVDSPCAVLVRALEPLEGLDDMALMRFGKVYAELTAKQKINLANGPGKLCNALGITRDHNSLNLCGNELYICEGAGPAFDIEASPRINIDYAGEYVDKPWRFYIAGNKYVSR